MKHCIQDNIEIRIIEVNGDKVKIGIDAPKNVPILRKELCQTVESNKEAAASATPDVLRNMLSGVRSVRPVKPAQESKE